jgi:hypothetical protein
MVAASEVHMNNNRASHAMFASNVLYFAAAALATVYVVSEAWHYGFWFTPFPFFLTLLALAFIGATTMGTLFLTRGIVRWLSLGAFLQLLGLAASHGAFLSPPATIEQILTIMFGIIAAEAAIVMVATCKGMIPHAPLSERAQSSIRKLALLLPLPIMAFAALQFYVQGYPLASPFIQQATTTYLIGERVLFGLKRTDALCWRMVDLEMRDVNLPAAELYARYAVLNSEHPILRLDPQDVERRHLENHRKLALIYCLEGDGCKSRNEQQLSLHGCDR